jgi:hypothetical protein
MFLKRAMLHNLGIENIAAVHASPHHTFTQVNTSQNIVSVRQKQSLTTLTIHNGLLVLHAVLLSTVSRSAPVGTLPQGIDLLACTPPEHQDIPSMTVSNETDETGRETRAPFEMKPCHVRYAFCVCGTGRFLSPADGVA